jgi:hypothetical protein
MKESGSAPVPLPCSRPRAGILLEASIDAVKRPFKESPSCHSMIETVEYVD